ncbi:hypothetical protein OS493_026138 [Desmophyllum pertusum]|uniref:Uncharacterized protein n=1 Tax=Desmophyllum pertusum TaxID=174260 RepID=A0A9W9ZZJ4_9CNID|nr:hypothetical protein OS493_026138 [Desmophyllum pertusum]
MRAEFYGCVFSDRYQAVGRVVHMDFVQEHLRTKKNVNFGNSQERPNNIELEVLADTIYVKGDIKMHGIKKLMLYSRKVTSAADSRLDLSAPTLTQTFVSLIAGTDGDDGEQGVPGPIVEIFADVSNGYLNILTNGGNGNKGQDGQDGKPGVDREGKRADKTEQDCTSKATKDADGRINGCTENIPGSRGQAGGNGEDGGDAGKAGNGANAGHQTLNVRRVTGKVDLKTCRGSGAQAATNGKGGKGKTINSTNKNIAKYFRPYVSIIPLWAAYMLPTCIRMLDL